MTILIGSFARDSYDENSDIDVVRIGHKEGILFDEKKYLSHPISYIDYDESTFEELYKNGSLFFHHIFLEGKPLMGDSEEWEELKQNFIVSKRFDKVIQEYTNLLQFLNDFDGFINYPISFLSNLYKALKNLSIFKLAQRGVYEYDKYLAIEKCFEYERDSVEYLITANNSFERGININSQKLLVVKKNVFWWNSEISHILRKCIDD